MERGVVQRYKASLGVALALTFSSISLAAADTTPTPTPSVTADPYKVAIEQFKRDRDAFNASMRDREIKMREINMTFKSAVDKANQDARTALATATTPLQKTTITSARRSAIDAAINARDSAIAALGDAPQPPMEPMKSPRPMMGAEPKGKQRR